MPEIKYFLSKGGGLKIKRVRHLFSRAVALNSAESKKLNSLYRE